MKKITFLMFFMITALAATAQSVFINELHYDNTGGDTGEAVEVAGPAGTDLTGWSIEPYNGSNGQTYSITALSGIIADQSGTGFGTISVSISGLQNGAPDGLALVDAGGTAVQFLSYEGSFTATNGSANGMTSTDIGVAELGGDPVGQSLQLTGTGNEYGDFTWQAPATASFGAINAGQTFPPVAPPPAGQECSTIGAVIAPAMPGASYDVTIPITASGTIGEDTNQINMTNVFLDDFQHDEANALTVTLTDPSGAVTHTLFSNVGGVDGLSGTRDINFEDGTNDITAWTGGGTFGDPYQAQDGAFNGEMGGAFQGVDIFGDWTLTITNGGNAGGSLAAACITFVDRGLVGNVPTITCPTPNPFVIVTEPGTCTAEVVFSDASASDVEDTMLTVVRTDMTGLNSGDQFPLGDTTISFMVTDSDGNSASCDFLVTVNDDQAPTVTCADNITQDNDAGACGANVTVPAPTFMDNCPVAPADVTYTTDGGMTVSSGDDASGFYPVGTTTIEYTYTDAGGASATCSVDVTVVDAEAPVIACEGAFTASPATSTINPGTTISNGAGDVYTETIDVTLDTTIEDLNINLDISHSFIADLQITLTSPNMTSVLIYDGGNDGCSSNDLTLTLDDESANILNGNCGPGTGNPAYTFADAQPSNPLAAFIGEDTVGTWTFTIEDTFFGDGGPINSLGLVFTFDDSMAPPPFDVTLLSDGTATVAASSLVSSATDNCTADGDLVYSSASPAPSCASANEIDVDPIGGVGLNDPTAIYANDFTVDPNTNFVLSDIDIALLAFNGEEYSNADVTFYEDNAGTPGAQIGAEAGITMTEVSRVVFNADIETVIYNIDIADFTFENMSATDAATYWIGLNTFDASTTIYGVATTATLVGANLQSSVDGGATFSDVLAPRDGVYSFNGSCVDLTADTTMVTFSCENVGLNNVDVTVTDEAGNESTCTAIVNVIDNIAPVLVCMDFTLELDDNGVATLDPNDAIDDDATVEACGYEATASQTDFSCADIGSPVLVDIFVIDPSGNVASCMATITVVDVNGPVVTCPDDQTVSPEATGVYTLEDFTGLATATDGCDGNVDVISQSPAPGAQLGVGTYTITMTSTDSMGNEGTCTFELTVEQIAGVGESELDAAIALYPNPASEIVNLSNNSTIALERAAIYNVNGQLVNDVNLDGMIGERTIDVSSLASGVYMVQISGENNVVVKRLIIE